ncbi:MAG: hypothetical protein ACYDAC_06150 [Candidatus Dormibacteria bacterium]
MSRIPVELNVGFSGRTFAEVEAGIMDELRRRVASALEAELRAMAGEVGPPPCPQCHGPRRRRGLERRRIIGLFGTVEIARPRLECAPCAASSYVLDRRLDLATGERYSLGVAEAAL